MPFIPNSDDDRKVMLEQIGVNSFDELISAIPEDVQFKGKLDLPEQLSEYEAMRLLESYSNMNVHTGSHVCFTGGGAYDRFIPAIVPAIMDKPEFRTAYTPYQAEVSQGTLQAMYEFQSMICELTAMEVSNASMYDAATSLAEAALMSFAKNKKTEVLIAGTINPNYIKVAETICKGKKITFKEIKNADGTADLDALRSAVNENTSAVVVQHPNFYGDLEDVYEIEKITRQNPKALYISIFDVVTLALLDPPGKYNADIAIGEAQQLGVPLSYGGPYVGLFTCKEKFIRQLPGRIAGITTDEDDKRAFTLTLQTREQQIKREKATSNICTNQGLFMLATTVYMETIGREGLKEVAENSMHNAHYLADQISNLNGYEILNKSDFIFEFHVKTPVDPSEIITEAIKNGIMAGLNTSIVNDGPKGLLIATTEKRNKKEMDDFVEFLAKFS